MGCEIGLYGRSPDRSAICVKTGIIFKMRNTLFFMYGHRTFTAPVQPVI